MAFSVTPSAFAESQGLPIKPNIVLQIDGVTTVYSAVQTEEPLRYGDPRLEYGPDHVYGGTIELDDSESFITFDGTSKSIKQNLDPDRGIGGSISSFKISLIDKNEEMTKLITPGEVVADVLGRKCKVWFGFKENTAFPDDYFVLFRGIIDDIKSEAGKITFNITHPDKKKNQEIYIQSSTDLDGAISDSDTTISVTSAGNFLAPITGPSGGIDADFESYIRINDEIIQFTGISGNDLTGCVRGTFNTTAAAHSDEDGVDTIYRLKGNALDMAIKLMASGFDGPFVEDIDIANFNVVPSVGTVSNTIFVTEKDLTAEYGLRVGDYITTVDATNGANNVTEQLVTAINVIDVGTYITVDGVSFVDEEDSPGTLAIRSQYDVWPAGLRMANDEIDIDEHLLLRNRFLTAAEYDFRLKDTINGKEFLDQEVYSPIACYSIPRKAQASLGYHIGPIPGDETKTFNENNIINPKNLKVRRSISRNFYNTIIYAFEESDTEADKFLGGNITLNATSQTQIPVGTKSLTIESRGLRVANNAENVATQQANRRLKRYAFAAESLDGVQLFFKNAFNVEIGDIIVFDASALGLPDSKEAKRGMEPRLMEVINTEYSIQGMVKVNLVDTNFDRTARYGLFSPGSEIDLVFGTSSFRLKDSTFNSLNNEGEKWSRYIDAPVKVRVVSPDYTTRDDTAEILLVQGNKITLKTALSFTPQVGDFMILSVYNDQPSDITLRYTFMRDSAFDDGAIQYQMI